MYKYIVMFFLVIYCSVGYSQDQFLVDSLLVEYKNAEEDTSKINILKELARQYFGSDLIEAIDYIDKALTIAEKSNNKVQIIKMNRAKGGLLTYMGNYTLGIEYFLIALKIAEEINELEEVFPLYINLGAVHGNIKEYEQAKESYLKALNVYNSLTSESRNKVKNKLGTLYNNLGNIYKETSDKETAETYYLKSLGIGIECEDIKLQIFPMRNLGEIYIENNSKKAYEFVNKALLLAKSIENKDEVAKSYRILAKYHININDYSRALEVTDSSYSLAEQIGSLKTMKEAAKLKFSIYEKLGNFNKAYFAHKNYKQLSDSLVNETTISQITSAEMQYEYNKKEIANLAKQQKKELITIVFISILLLGLIIVILVFILSRNRHKRIELERDKLKQKVELKNKELATNVMYLLKKNEFMNSVSTRLLNIKNNLKEENKQPIQKIIFDLQSSIDKEVWEEFEVRFQKVHSEFYNNLQKKFPDLSPTERKLAALLRLDMSSKDIASLTGQSIKSVEVARSRLRKKLNITSQDINLVNFLLDI